LKKRQFGRETKLPPEPTEHSGSVISLASGVALSCMAHEGLLHFQAISRPVPLTRRPRLNTGLIDLSNAMMKRRKSCGRTLYSSASSGQGRIGLKKIGYGDLRKALLARGSLVLWATVRIAVLELSPERDAIYAENLSSKCFVPADLVQHPLDIGFFLLVKR